MYYINGESLGIAFEQVEIADDINYRLYIGLCDTNACVEIVDFSINIIYR